MLPGSKGRWSREFSRFSIDLWFLCRLITWNYHIFLDLAIPYDIGTSSSLGEQLEETSFAYSFVRFFFWGHMYASLAQAKSSPFSCCVSYRCESSSVLLLAKKLHGVAVGPWFGLAGTWARCSGQSPGHTDDVGENGGVEVEPIQSVALQGSQILKMCCIAPVREMNIRLTDKPGASRIHKPLKGGHEETCEDVHPWY